MLKTLGFLSVILIALLLIIENLCAWGLNHGAHYTCSKNYFVPNEALGYAPVKNTVSSESEEYNGRSIYAANYTIGPDGLRITPPSVHTDNAVLFFGSSVMFGEGLKDNETTPFVVGDISHLRVYNFSFNGYGPHQMLSAIEHGQVSQVVGETRPKYAIFQTDLWGAMRVSGRSSWDRHGPKYVLQSDGTVKYCGHFDDDLKGKWSSFFKDFIEASKIYGFFVEDNYQMKPADIQQYVAVIAQARDELQKRYPGIEFHVIFWDWRLGSGLGHLQQEAESLLMASHIKVHLINDVLPDFKDYTKEYVISPYNAHPNALANRLIAQYIVKKIMGVSKSGGDLKE